jgi:YcxB-like protein
MIEIDVRLTPADVTAVRWFLLVRRWGMWVFLLSMVGLAVAAIADGAPSYYAALLIGPPVGMPLWHVFVAPRRTRRFGHPAAAAHRWTVSDNEVRYVTFDEDGSQLSEGRARWDALQRVSETRDAFLLFRTPQVCNPIPRRCFASDADVDRFRELAADHGLLR